MRKVFWCFTGAGVLMAGVLSSASYYACGHPDTMIGHCLNTVASASMAMQPVTVLATKMAKATHHAMSPEETTTTAGSSEECVPADPQPITAEPAAEWAAGISLKNAIEVEQGPAPIVINEDEPIHQNLEETEAPPSTIEFKDAQAQELPESACPMVMPYCTDDEPMPTPTMPYADGATKQADGSEASEDSAFKAWTMMLRTPPPVSKPESGEELPAPAEEAQDEPKCQEDSHLHEHYSGCPHMTCPYTGKTYPSCPPAMKSGKEEISETPDQAAEQVKQKKVAELMKQFNELFKLGKYAEAEAVALRAKDIDPENPMVFAAITIACTQQQQQKHPHSGKGGKHKESCPPTTGVDTMEYRRSDGGLNEFGPGPF